MMRLMTWMSALLAVVLTAGLAPAADGGKINVVYIMADDLGWTDLACYGSKYYETPNIDRLAAQGMKFTSGYTCGPNCQPTRAALMSGQYNPRTGVYTVGGIERFNWQSRPLRPVDNVAQLPLEKVILPQPIKQAGYVTGMFGKWHLGEAGDHHPGKRGFDEAIVSMGKHYDFGTSPKQDVPKGVYLADWLTDRAVDFIQRHKDRPFFLYLPHFGVHSPFQAKPELIEKFKKKEGVGGHNDPVYAAMIYSVDESVGRVMKTLEELKLDGKTLVVFTSDNGGVGGYVREGLKQAGDVTDNAPLRSGKGSLYEGGVRVPFIFRLPGTIAAGSVADEPICSVDIYPTLMSLTGSKAPSGQPLDGVDLTPVLRSGGSAKLGRAIYWHFPGYLGAGSNTWRTTPAGAVREGDWKLLEFLETGEVELYNLASDLSQKNNLASAEPARAKAMQEKLAAWRKEIGAKMPAANTDIKPAADSTKAGKGKGDGKGKGKGKGKNKQAEQK